MFYANSFQFDADQKKKKLARHFGTQNYILKQYLINIEQRKKQCKKSL